MGRYLKALTIFFLITALGCCAFITGCNESQWDKTHSNTDHGFEMQMMIEGTQLRPGETLTLRVTVRNISDSEKEYTMWNLGDPAIYTEIDTPFGDSFDLKSPSDPDVVQPAVTHETLEAGEIIEREVTWKVSENDPNGTYVVNARFFPGRYTDTADSQTMLLSQDIKVIDSIELIDADEIKQKAADLPSIKLWLNAHTGEAAAREQKGNYIVNMAGEWQSANAELYQQARSSAETPSIELDLETSPSRWTVSYSSKFGFPPDQISADFNAETGEFINVNPNLQEELSGGVVADFKVGSFEFSIFVTNPDTIEQLYALQRGESAANIPNGLLLPGPGKGLHNAPWSWHLDPQETEMAEFTIEVCDGTPEFVEEELEYWLGSVKRYCPWNAELVNITDYR
jgi:hypothetical protein